MAVYNVKIKIISFRQQVIVPKIVIPKIENIYKKTQIHPFVWIVNYIVKPVKMIQLVKPVLITHLCILHNKPAILAVLKEHSQM